MIERAKLIGAQGDHLDRVACAVARTWLLPAGVTSVGAIRASNMRQRHQAMMVRMLAN